MSCIQLNKLEICKMLNNALEVVENIAALNDFYSMLSSHFIPYYWCPKCYCSSASLSIIYESISLYKQNNELSFFRGA